MKRLSVFFVCLSLSVLVLNSCVSKRRYYAAIEEQKDLRSQNANLSSTISMQQDSINRLHNNINSLGDMNESANQALNETNSQLNMTKEQVVAERARLRQLEGYIAMQQKNTEDLRKKIAESLVGFNTNELTVTIKNGKVYVSMQESLLFPSGSAVVNPRGKDALLKLATVLNTNPDINIDIEGHTDNVPIHSKLYADNWALSTARATSIGHILIDDYKVTPVRIVASGRSEYAPIADNGTPEGRAQNRRTEIILVPKLDELMQAINSPTGTVTNK